MVTTAAQRLQLNGSLGAQLEQFYVIVECDYSYVTRPCVKVMKSEKLEDIRMTVIQNMLKYHPEAADFLVEAGSLNFNTGSLNFNTFDE